MSKRRNFLGRSQLKKNTLYKCTFIKTKHVPLLNRSQQVRCYPYQSMMKGMEEQTSARSSRSKRNKCGPVLSE